MLAHAEMLQLLADAKIEPGLMASRPDPAEAMPSASGSYLLLIALSRCISLPFGRYAGCVLPAGHYAYAGSAKGPGGLRARVGRHLRRQKRLRWHVDALTAAAEDIHALLFPGKTVNECDLVSALLASGHFEIVLPGLGSSDCRSCPAHVLRLREES